MGEKRSSGAEFGFLLPHDRIALAHRQLTPDGLQGGILQRNRNLDIVSTRGGLGYAKTLEGDIGRAFFRRRGQRVEAEPLLGQRGEQGGRRSLRFPAIAQDIDRSGLGFFQKLTQGRLDIGLFGLYALRRTDQKRRNILPG